MFPETVRVRVGVVGVKFGVRVRVRVGVSSAQQSRTIFIRDLYIIYEQNKTV